MNDEERVIASARLYVPSERVERLVENMLEWSHENGARLAVARTGPEEVSISTDWPADDCANGTFSAAVWLGTAVERALSELSEYRWFGGAVIKAAMKAERDENPEPKVERVPDLSACCRAGLELEAPGSGDLSVICSQCGERAAVWREEEVPPPAPVPQRFTDQVAADEAEYERTRPERADEF